VEAPHNPTFANDGQLCATRRADPPDRALKEFGSNGSALGWLDAEP